jgi:DNA repair ATPase RecN
MNEFRTTYRSDMRKWSVTDSQSNPIEFFTREVDADKMAEMLNATFARLMTQDLTASGWLTIENGSRILTVIEDAAEYKATAVQIRDSAATNVTAAIRLGDTDMEIGRLCRIQSAAQDMVNAAQHCETLAEKAHARCRDSNLGDLLEVLSQVEGAYRSYRAAEDNYVALTGGPKVG